MATAAVQSPNDVQTTLNYYKATDDQAPYNYTYEPPVGTPSTNVGTDTQPVVVRDARGRESEFSLDTSGFQFATHVSEEKEFVDEEKITTTYYKEVEDLLKNYAGAKRVHIFDHTIRRFLNSDYNSPNKRGPVERVHIDQTYEASVQRVYRHLGPDAPRLLNSRVRIINVWRPISHPVAHHPLAVSDWRALDTTRDLVSTRHIYPDREGSTYSVKYNPQHRWWYLSSQTPEEVTFIKCYDSEVDRARLTPHSAFLDATSPKEAPHRESIEVRALVFDVE